MVDGAAHETEVALPGPLGVVRVEEGPEGPAGELVPGVAEHRLVRHVGGEEAALGVDPADADRGLLDQDRPHRRGVLPAPQRTCQLPHLVLAADVLYEARFKKANPDYVAGKQCVYVGMTGLNPDVRFDKHKAGIQANKFVQKFGLRLLTDLYEAYNPMPYDGARDMEVELAIGLREAGYGVWQA